MELRVKFVAGLSVLCLAGGWLNSARAEEAAASQNQADDKKDAGESKNQEVVIKGVQRLRVKVEKPDPDVKFDVDEIVVPYVKTEDYVLDVSPTSMTSPGVSIPARLNSVQVASPFIQLFQRPPIFTLRPRYKSKVAISKWRVRVTDGMGNVFRDFSGRDNLPELIVWDGLSKTNEMADVGTSYSYIFSILDVASNPTSQMGKPIVMESLLYEENGWLVAKVVSDVLFEKTDKNRTKISKKGELYLREVADYLTSRQNYPLVIEAYAKDVDNATYRAEMIRDYLADRLILPQEKFKINSQKATLEKIVFRIR